MKIKLYHIAMALLFVFSGCGKDEEFITITPDFIAFAHADGTPITAGECINPFESYAVLIKTKSEGKGSFKTRVVEYTVNGASHSMTFMRDGTQVNKITLIEGLNIAQIVESGYVATLNFANQGDFELVE